MSVRCWCIQSMDYVHRTCASWSLSSSGTHWDHPSEAFRLADTDKSGTASCSLVVLHTSVAWDCTIAYSTHRETSKAREVRFCDCVVTDWVTRLRYSLSSFDTCPAGTVVTLWSSSRRFALMTILETVVTGCSYFLKVVFPLFCNAGCIKLV